MGLFPERCFALTGGIGTGKSTVANMLRKSGARVVDTDIIARQVVKPGQPALLEIKRYFGHKILNHDGNLNRQAMRKAIISDPKAKETLDRITHPYIYKMTVDKIETYLQETDRMPVVVDVPLLYEVGWDFCFPFIIVVYTPKDIQIMRLMARDGVDKATAESMLAIQMDIEEKKRRAHHVIDNSMGLEYTRKQVDILLSILMQRCY